MPKLIKNVMLQIIKYDLNLTHEEIVDMIVITKKNFNIVILHRVKEH